MVDVPIIQTLGLSKSYGHFIAVRGLTLSVARHRITAFVGLNGAGKSTTLKMLLGIIRPSSGGSGKVLGQTITDPRASRESRRNIAYVSEHKALYEYMTVEQMIRFTSAFYADWCSDKEQKLLKQYRLPRSALIKTLSKGMRTKLHLLLAFARRPALQATLGRTITLENIDARFQLRTALQYHD
ncbi:MAG TPA: ABC transporter ATP-binding protein [Edaphobacter sp.]|nr:ABC transporter ATP-binding protein [Edaphobacter sp.]